jgi:hypothetical protein
MDMVSVLAGAVCTLIFLEIAVRIIIIRQNKVNRKGNGDNRLAPTEDNIDPHILPFVAALNKSGLAETVGSCEGHIHKDYATSTYVRFKSALPFAYALQQRINNAHISKSSRPLSLNWKVCIDFDYNGSLAYTLEMEYFIKMPFLPLRWRYNFGWFREQREKDIALLCEMVRDLAQSVEKIPSSDTTSPDCRGL